MFEEEYLEEPKQQIAEGNEQVYDSENDGDSGNELSEVINPDSIEDYCQQYVDSFQKSERSFDKESAIKEGGDKNED